jgi:signal transduction histidine kinase/ActR/RegA family two-component response regulator
MARVLIVDDRPVNIELLATMLGYLGHEAESAADGAEAWARLESGAMPQLLITDLVMPNLGGEDLIRRLRAEPATADLPVIIHTASYRSRDARGIAAALGVRWILPKPCDLPDLAAMVADALGEPVPAQGGAGAARPGPEPDPRTRQNMGERLAAMVDLALKLGQEEEPQGLVALFCDATARMLRVRYVGIAMFAPDGSLNAFAARGLDAGVVPQVQAEAGSCPAAAALMVRSGPGMLLAARPGDFTGLPAAHPPVRTLMACAVRAHDGIVGWMYGAERIDGSTFLAEDERVLLALAAVLGTRYSSMLAMDALDRRVAERTRELEAANAELDAFSLLVSHDLRAPLAKVAGLVQVLQHTQAATLTPAAGHLFERIAANVSEMTALTGSLLEFARMSRQPVRMASVALDAVARGALDAHAEEIARRQVGIVLHPLPVCQCDASLMAQVFANLVGNAVKYTRRRDAAAIEIGAHRVAGEVLVFVQDNGAGFDAAAADGLFAPFKRFHAAAEFEGTGVGLAVVRQIVNRHGGRVWAESRPGEGARFTFTLPVS